MIIIYNYKKSAFKKNLFLLRVKRKKERKRECKSRWIRHADKESTVSTLSVLTAGSSYVTWSGPLRFFRTAIQSCALRQSVRVDDYGNRRGCVLHAAWCSHDPCKKTSFLGVRRGSGPVEMVGHCAKHRNLKAH